IDRATPPSRLITFAETIDHHRRNPQLQRSLALTEDRKVHYRLLFAFVIDACQSRALRPPFKAQLQGRHGL
ncbi:hypothetical protein, partial [Burkholderia multivorans]|uniref:hypothetical protein n=1 Tax=Burkholderia multivorans TaxID=87883 RepID=UPI002870316C